MYIIKLSFIEIVYRICPKFNIVVYECVTSLRIKNYNVLTSDEVK